MAFEIPFSLSSAGGGDDAGVLCIDPERAVIGLALVVEAILFALAHGKFGRLSAGSVGPSYTGLSCIDYRV